MNNGYVKIHRSLEKKGYYQDSHYVHLWVHLIMKATYCDREYLFNGKIEHLKPGQFITGRNSLSKDTGIHRSKVDRILKVFENEHQIEQQMTNKFRIISITNWDKYQTDEQQIEQQMSIKRASSEHQVSTNNKEKNNKKENNNLLIPDWLDQELWTDFKDHRKKLKKPMTLKAEQILIAKLEHLKGEGHNPKHLLLTAIERGWQSVFAPNAG